MSNEDKAFCSFCNKSAETILIQSGFKIGVPEHDVTHPYLMFIIDFDPTTFPSESFKKEVQNTMEMNLLFGPYKCAWVAGCGRMGALLDETPVYALHVYFY
jgi:hypothetical protein